MKSTSRLFVASTFTVLLACAMVSADTGADAVVDGDAAGDRFGHSVAGVGDVNDDGHDDYVVGAYFKTVGGDPQKGRVYVLSGIDSALIWSQKGEFEGDQFGWAVAGAGDTNGDGVPDILVGARRFDGSEVDRGRAYLLDGTDGSILWSFTGASADDELGTAVSSLGDMDDDGAGDVLVGAPGAGNGDGRVYLLSGADGTLIHEINGLEAGGQFGISVAGLGDVNDDGLADYAVGASNVSLEGAASGRAYVIGGSSTSEAVDVIYTFMDGQAGDEFGTSVANVGDVDADGLNDVGVGAPFADGEDNPMDDDRGAFFVYASKDGSTLHDLVGAEPGDSFGRSAASRGDWDLDGFNDFLVCAPKHASTGRLRIISGATGEALLACTGEAAGDDFGFASATIGDMNGDGATDVVVGARFHDTAGEDAGRTYVFLGAPPECPECTGDLSDDGEVDGADLGILLGNWNGTGCTDIDGNGTTDGGDLGLLLGAWGPCPLPPCPGEGDCCTDNGSPGCDDLECCEAVCAVDPVCCEVAWDGSCAEAAVQLCDQCVETGGCCLPGGGCQNFATESECLDQGGIYLGTGSDCPPGGCAGACCFTDGTCTTGGFGPCADAGGVFQGFETSCDALECLVICGEGAGECCFPEGNGTPGCDDAICCELVCEQDAFCCDEVWDSGCAAAALELCEFCQLPGACCLPDGSCLDGVTANACAAEGGVFQGGGTTCATIECAGACCFINGSCSVISFGACLGSGGVFQGFGTDCDTVDCPVICGTGAGDCCINNGTPGCDDGVCCDDVCSLDPLCCEEVWDDLCAETAAVLCVVCGGKPLVNDECGGALFAFDGDTAFSTVGATPSAGFDLPAECDEGSGLSFVNDIWYVYNATCDGTVTISTCDTADYDTRLAVYSNCTGASLISCNDDGPDCTGGTSILTFDVTLGSLYVIRVGGVDGSGTGVFNISCTE